MYVLHKNDFHLKLDAMSLAQSLVLLVEHVDPVDHLLDELHLRVAQPVLVGDVVGDAWTEAR